MNTRPSTASAAGAVLQTPRLCLRLLDADVPAHAALYRALYTCPRVMASVMPPLDRDAADAAFGRVCRHNRSESPGHRFWSIDCRRTGRALGLAALQRSGTRAEFGVMVAPDAWRMRVASGAMQAVLAHAFERMGLQALDVHRPDDAHVPAIDSLISPFGFTRVDSIRPGHCSWELPAARWRTARGDAVGFAPARE